jgi:hypothetical protein
MDGERRGVILCTSLVSDTFQGMDKSNNGRTSAKQWLLSEELHSDAYQEFLLRLLISKHSYSVFTELTPQDPIHN